MKTIVISGSIKKAGMEIEKFAKELEKLGYNVIYPKMDLKPEEWDNLSEVMLKNINKGRTLGYFAYIEKADLVFIYNKDGYSGNSTTMELTYAYAMKKPIYELTKDEEITKDILFDGYASTPKELTKFIN